MNNKVESKQNNWLFKSSNKQQLKPGPSLAFQVLYVIELGFVQSNPSMDLVTIRFIWSEI